MAKFEAVIFDMDGVLVDTEAFYMKQLQKFSDAYDLGVTHEELIDQVGASHDHFQKMVQSWFVRKGINDYDQYQAEKVFEEWAVCMPRHYNELMFDGVPETLQKLNDAGIKVALASSTPMYLIETAMGECNLAKQFVNIVSGEQFSESKPNPEIYIHSVEALGLRPGQCCCIEDSNIGITAGKAADLTVIARREDRFNVDQSEADYIVDTIPEILSIVL